MKKLIRIFLAVALIFCNTYNSYASFLSPIVSRLIPASAVAGAAGSITIPALIKGTTSGGLNVSSWLPLLIPGGNVAKIAAAVVGIGGALALDYLFLKGAAWFAARNITKENGILKITELVARPNDPNFVGNVGPGGGFVIGGQSAALVVAQAYAASHCSVASAGNDGIGNYYIYAYSQCVGAPDRYELSKWYYIVNGGISNQNVSRNISAPEIEAFATTDLAANNANAKALGLAAVEATAGALDDPANPINMNAAIKAAMAAALSGSLTQAQKDALEGQGTTSGTIPVPETTDYTKLTPGQITTAVTAALASQGLTAAQIAAAVAAAVTASQGQNLTSTQAQAAVAAALASQGLTANQIAAAVAAAQGQNLTSTQAQAAVAAALASQGLTAAQIAAAVSAAQGQNLTSAESQAAVAAALSSQGLSAAQIAAAVAAAVTAEQGKNLTAAEEKQATKEATKEAIDDETGVSIPLDPNFIIPDKLSLTTVLTNFMNSIRNMPFLSALSGITIQCSGSSSLCLNLPAKFGGNVCYDAAPITNALNNIGTAMLSCTTIVMFIYIFRSN